MLRQTARDDEWGAPGKQKHGNICQIPQMHFDAGYLYFVKYLYFVFVKLEQCTQSLDGGYAWAQLA